MKNFLIIAAFLVGCTKQSETMDPKPVNPVPLSIDTIKVNWFMVNINLDSPVIHYSYYMDLDKPLPDTAYWVASWKTVSGPLAMQWNHTETFKLFPGVLKQYHVSSIPYEVQNQNITSSILYLKIDSLGCPGVVFNNNGSFYQ